MSGLPERTLLVEIKTLYVNTDVHRQMPHLGVRFASIEVEMPHVVSAPVALSMVVGESRLEYLAHEGRLYRGHGERLRQGAGDALPSVVFTGIWHGLARQATPEHGRDRAESGRWREQAIDAAMSWSKGALVVGEGDQMVCVLSVDEPLLVVVPPGDTTKAPWIDPYQPNQLPALRTVHRTGAEERKSDGFLAALREDRLFRVDERDDAALRAKEFGVRINRGRIRYELGEGRWDAIELSTPALRLAGREAIDLLGADGTPEADAAARALAAAIDDPDANAAALSPPVRTFLASFGSSPHLMKLSLEGDLAGALDRLRRAHDRAQKRMAAGRIPDRDPRELAPADDAAMGRLGP